MCLIKRKERFILLQIITKYSKDYMLFMIKMEK